MIRRLSVIAVALLLTFALAPATLADEHGTDRPLTGSMTGLMYFVPGDASCPFYTVTDGSGTMSHFGLVSAQSSHCAITHLGGQWVTTAANGDQLFAEYTVPRIPFRVYITGGTGRFAGATGWFDWDVHFQPVWGPDGMPISPWAWEGTLTGVISY
jgi:hypothetical protein